MRTPWRLVPLAAYGQRDVVKAAVESLSEQHRRILGQVYFRGRSPAQAARTLGIPVEAVKSGTNGALRELHRALRRHGALPAA